MTVSDLVGNPATMDLQAKVAVNETNYKPYFVVDLEKLAASDEPDTLKWPVAEMKVVTRLRLYASGALALLAAVSAAPTSVDQHDALYDMLKPAFGWGSICLENALRLLVADLHTGPAITFFGVDPQIPTRDGVLLWLKDSLGERKWARKLLALGLPGDKIQQVLRFY